MRYVFLTIPAFFLLNFVLVSNLSNPSMDLLVEYMEGEYSSESQSLADTNYLHITLDMVRIWEENDDGAWLYVEQTAAWTPGQPYRQRVYHLEQLTDSTFSSTIMSIPNPENYVGVRNNPELITTLSPDSLTELEGCALILHYENGSFSGETEKGSCLNSWGEATYATSEVVIYPDSLYSWDRGYNNEDEQVWGAENGGYMFVKK